MGPAQVREPAAAKLSKAQGLSTVTARAISIVAGLMSAPAIGCSGLRHCKIARATIPVSQAT